MFMHFSINNTNELLEDLVLHICDDDIPCNSTHCHTLQLVSSIRHYGLTFDKNLIRNLHVYS